MPDLTLSLHGGAGFWDRNVAMQDSTLLSVFPSTVSTAISKFESMVEGDVAVRKMCERVCREVKIGQT
jgi:hypothetical protein